MSATTPTITALYLRSPPRPLHHHHHHFPLKPSLRHSIKHLTFTTTTTIKSLAAAPFSPPPLPSLSPLSLSSLTPLTVCKYSLFAALAVAAAKQTLAAALSPFVWSNFTLAVIFWPWLLAATLAAYALYSLHRYAVLRRAAPFEQLAIVIAAVSWLTVVPAAHFNGFLEGWPIVLFFVYHYFFFFESSVRRRLYGDLYPREHDPKWDVALPQAFQVGFAALVLIGHWLAAYEGPEIHLISGGWANVGTWVLVLLTLFMRYHSVLYLANYSEKVVVPTAVVQFGPYRWVRHPIYASTMMLFALHCITLRAPLSLLFLMAVGVVYYGRKAELEEALMVETFGERYTEYMKKVRYRLIPFVY